MFVNRVNICLVYSEKNNIEGNLEIFTPFLGN